GFSVSGYVHFLEDVVASVLAVCGVPSAKDACAIGVWTQNEQHELAKIAAIGVRIRRGVTLHGLALNVTTDLSFFDLIVPCGLAGRAVTSMKELLGDRTPSMEEVKRKLSEKLVQQLGKLV